MSCTLNYVFPASSKTEHIKCLLTECTTQDEDKNAINMKFIVSLAKMFVDYFLPTL